MTKSQFKILINTGFYIFDNHILGEIPKNTFLNFDKLVQTQ